MVYSNTVSVEEIYDVESLKISNETGKYYLTTVEDYVECIHSK